MSHLIGSTIHFAPSPGSIHRATHPPRQAYVADVQLELGPPAVTFRTSEGNSGDGIDASRDSAGPRWGSHLGGSGANAKSSNYLWIDDVFIAGKPMTPCSPR